MEKRSASRGLGNQTGGPSTSRNDEGPSLLGRLLDNARRATARAAGAGPIDRETWRRAVGDRVASRTVLGQLEHGRLDVLVSSSVWAQELSLLSRDVVERLRRLGFPVDRIRFRVGPIPNLEPLARVVPAANPARLPPSLAQLLEQVDDPGLRASIAEAASHSLGRRALAPTPEAPPEDG